MNPVAEEILSYYGIAQEQADDIEHYGMPRRSGRYPYGSGEDPYQHNRDFLSRVEEMRKEGFTYTDKNGKTYTGDTAIAKSMNLSTTEFRTELAVVNNERKMLQYARAKSLKEDGKGWTEIGKEMGVSESTVRGWLENPKFSKNITEAQNAADFIKQQIDKKGMIDVGAKVCNEINISKERMDQALYLLKRDGYEIYGGRVEQPTNKGQFTTIKVACPPGTPHKEIYNTEKIHSLNEYICRDGVTIEKKFTYPESMDSKRLMIRYNEDGGIEKDGIVELRRNVPDLSLGESRYSQVRILVDGTHYIKGMAVYSDDLPKGVDVVFNTNKKRGTAMTDVLKKIKDDPDNPFGSLIKDADQGGQYWYDPKTGERVSSKHPDAKLGLINKRSDEGDWSDWKDAVPSQFLAKQSLPLAKKQLKLALTEKLDEYDAICKLENPTIKKHLLNKFADECDSSAVHLKAAALPGQKYNVIIPVNTLKDDEVYAPRYKDGTKLALIRYPHGGTFEIPICTVNNKHAAAIKMLGKDISDAVGVNSKVAERLSGADFDGDTVMCIPTNDPKGKVKITSTPKLKGLEGFDPKVEYGPDTYEKGTIKLMTKRGTQKQMGVISNLITDMTLAKATNDELAAAVRHSMVVIDAEKHKLNYKKSEMDNNIAALHKKYQGKKDGGASTIISKAKGEYTVPKRQGTPKVNLKYNKKGELNDWYDPSKPEGSLIYKTADDLYYPVRKVDKAKGIMEIKLVEPRKKVSYKLGDKEAEEFYRPIKKVDPDTGEVTYTNKTGEYQYRVDYRKQKSTNMAETDDAYTLVSDARHPMELVYADHANSMKSLANQARKEMMATGKIEYRKDAAATYRAEVDSLMSKLNEAEKNTPRERLATIKANAEIKAKKEANPNMTNEEIKKFSQQAINKYRQEVGSIKRSDRAVNITDREWEAIQAGAISESKLKRILNNADIDSLRERATPRATVNISAVKQNRIKQLSASNYTLQEIADKLNVPVSTVSNVLRGVN